MPPFAGGYVIRKHYCPSTEALPIELRYTSIWITVVLMIRSDHAAESGHSADSGRLRRITFVARAWELRCPAPIDEKS